MCDYWIEWLVDFFLHIFIFTHYVTKKIYFALVHLTCLSWYVKQNVS